MLFIQLDCHLHSLLIIVKTFYELSHNYLAGEIEDGPLVPVVHLMLDKKETKSRDIHKPKCLGSTERNILGLENRLNPEAFKLRIIPT